MSIEARVALCRRLHFQDMSQRSDLLDPDLTNTQLVALLTDLLNHGCKIVITAVRSDHHDDSGLGKFCHANGYCADVWPLASDNATDYLDAGDPRFAAFLADAASFGALHQIGLAGSAWNKSNTIAAGPSVFADDGDDHVHLGVHD
jgi:hypothetical protein